MTDKPQTTELEEIVARVLHRQNKQLFDHTLAQSLNPWHEIPKAVRERWHDEARQVIGAIYGEGYQILPCKAITDD